MCGIYGAVALGERPLRHTERLDDAGPLLRHRGPDAHGLRRGPMAALGCERLRVFDPTPAGDQPFADPSDRIWLVLNGAIYNAPELRARYSDYAFRSRTDAETVLPLFLELGSDCFAELDGMFAIAIYDARHRELHLARDRAGEKPLFFSAAGDEIWFASEIQALLNHPVRSRIVDTWAVRDFVTLGYVTEPRTMFSGIEKVRAGTCVTFSRSGQEMRRYWMPPTATEQGGNDSEMVPPLETLLVSAVEKQVAADVPVGVFTSGGVDSSLLAAIAARVSAAEVPRTFSVGFTEQEYDESPYGERLASFLGTEHFSVLADRESLKEALGVLVEKLCEPSADPAILPTYLLARVAREQVKVVLGGEGADELFGGYPSYIGHRVASTLGRLPARLRGMLAGAANRLPSSFDRKVPIEYLLWRFFQGVDLPLAERHMCWFGTGIGPAVLHPSLRNESYEPPPFPASGDPISRACFFDYATYLRDNLLAKMDRATMLVSIEARAPYLDARVTEFALALDTRLRVRGITTKWLLKQVARRWLPREFVFRKKRGLSVPVATWLNGDLRPEVDRLLNSDRLERQGLLHPANVRQLLIEHQSRRVNHGRALWTLLMLEYWLERWVPGRD